MMERKVLYYLLEPSVYDVFDAPCDSIGLGSVPD